MVMTGCLINYSFAEIAIFGAGFIVAVGAGVLVQTGVTYFKALGPHFLVRTVGR
jgi:hypothetical protein